MIARPRRAHPALLLLLALVSGGVVLAQPPQAGPVATPRLPYRPSGIDGKAAGKWVHTSDGADIAVEIAADGKLTYSGKAAGGTFAMKGQLKAGELRLDQGKGMFLIYTATVVDGKLVLTDGNLDADQDIKFAKVGGDPVVVRGPNPGPQPMPPEPKGAAKKFERPRLPPGFDVPKWDVRELEEKFTILKCEVDPKTNQITFQLELKDDFSSLVTPYCRIGFFDAAGAKSNSYFLNFVPVGGRKGTRVTANAQTGIIAINREMWEQAATVKFFFE